MIGSKIGLAIYNVKIDIIKIAKNIKLAVKSLYFFVVIIFLYGSKLAISEVTNKG